MSAGVLRFRHLVLGDLRRRPVSSLVVLFALAAAVSMGLFALAVGLGLNSVIRRHVLRELPVDLLEVTAGRIQLGPLNFTKPEFLGGGLTPARVTELRRLPGVTGVYAEATLRVGARAEGSLFGHSLYTDLAITGVDPELVGGSAAFEPPFRDAPGGPIPVLVNSALFRLYNNQVAPAMGLPGLNAEALKGLGFNLTVGRSFVLGKAAARSLTEPARLAGVHERAIALGVTVPLATLERWEEYCGIDKPREYSALYVKVAGTAAAGRAAAAIAATGLAVNESQRLALSLTAAALALPGAFAALALMIATLAVAISTWWHARARRYEFAVMRAVGAPGRAIAALILWQAVIVGALGGLLGSVLAGAGLRAATGLLPADWLTALPFVPEVFQFPGWLWAVGLGLGIAASLAGALAASLAAAFAEPAKALVESS